MMIGIIGYGCVGKATHNGLLNGDHAVSVYDPALGYEILPTDTDVNFICVPTPTKKGKQDISNVEDTLVMLDESGYDGLIVIRSTILPRKVNYLIHEYENLNIMVNPEFLDQNRPYFIANNYLIGVKDIYQADIFRSIYFWEHRDSFRTTKPETAMMAKYAHNCYGALKVIFFNELKDACDLDGIDYREMVGAMLSSTNHISQCYTQLSVDGSRGFGGSCFPKDAVAFESDYGINTLGAAISSNRLLYRQPEMDAVL